MIDSNTTFFGSGMYSSVLFPEYQGKDIFQNIITIDGSQENRKKGVALHDFGIDGSDGQFHETENRGLDIGQWARIRLLFVDDFYASNIHYYHGSHLFHMQGCNNFVIENIFIDYSFSAVHMVSVNEDNVNGIIDKVTGTRMATMVDFGGGGRDILVSRIIGDAEGYVRNNEEAFDIGGAKNVIISDSILSNFNDGATVKGESGKTWDNVKFDNVVFKGFKRFGIRATRGTESESGRLIVSNTEFYSDEMGDNHYAIEVITGRPTVELENVFIDVNGGGFHSYDIEKVVVNNLRIKAGKRGFYLSSPDIYTNGSYEIYGIQVESGEEGIALTNCLKGILSDFYITDNTGYSLTVRGVTAPIIKNGLIEAVHGSAILLEYRADNIDDLNGANGLNTYLSDVVVKDWGLSAQYRTGITINVPDVTGSFKNLKLKGLSFEITSENNLQVGISWIGFENGGLDYSIIDATFYKVYLPQAGVNKKGDNVVENTVVIPR